MGGRSSGTRSSSTGTGSGRYVFWKGVEEGGGGDKIAGFSILCAVNTRTHPDGGERGFARLVPVH